jgi:hypothetical protein
MNLPFLRRLNKRKLQQQQAQPIEERPSIQITVSTSPITGDTCFSYETELYEGSTLRTSTTSTDDSSTSSSVFVDTTTNQKVLNSASQDPILLQSSKPSQLPSEYALQSNDSLQTNNQTEISTTSQDSSVESNASLISHDDYSLVSHDSLQTFYTSDSSLTTTSYSNQSQATVDSLLFHVALTKNGCQVRWCQCDHYN